MEKIQARVKRCGVDWRALRLARSGSNKGHFDRIMRNTDDLWRSRGKEAKRELSG